jgi:hypothetical protein
VSAGSGASVGSGGAGEGDGASAGKGGDSCPTSDSDGDGLIDRVEGYMASLPELASDDDYDMIPNYLDLDSDGDGMSDADEAGPHEICSPGRDTDFDGLPDFRDADSDNDEALDKDEVEHGLNPRSVDTDEDGCRDLEELMFAGCDAAHVVIGGTCHTDTTGTLKLRVSSDIPAGLSDVTLDVIASDEDEQASAAFDVLEFQPPSSGALADGKISRVEPGADVMIGFSADLLLLDTSGTYQYEVTLVSATEGVIASGGVLWIYEYCPIVK